MFCSQSRPNLSLNALICTQFHMWLHNFKLPHGPDYPSKVKAMLLARVARGAGSHLPSRFCSSPQEASGKPGCDWGMPGRQAPGVESKHRCCLNLAQDGEGQLGPAHSDSGDQKIDLKYEERIWSKGITRSNIRCLWISPKTSVGSQWKRQMVQKHSVQPHGLQPPGSSVRGILQARIL